MVDKRRSGVARDPKLLKIAWEQTVKLARSIHPPRFNTIEAHSFCPRIHIGDGVYRVARLHEFEEAGYDCAGFTYETLILREEMMKTQWIEKNGLQTPFAAALYGAPSRYGFYCTNEKGRFCFHNFHGTWAAKKFLDILLDGKGFKWAGSKRIITESGITIKGEYHTDLEEVLSYEYTKQERETDLPEPHHSMFRRFVNAAVPPPEHEADASSKRERAPRTPAEPRPDGLTSLAEICEELDIDPREARRALRKSSLEKPAWGWAWAAKDVPAVKRILQGK